MAPTDLEPNGVDVRGEVPCSRANRAAYRLRLIGSHNFQDDLISSLDLDKYREITETVMERTESEAIPSSW
jgi:hypothetical protein